MPRCAALSGENSALSKELIAAGSFSPHLDAMLQKTIAKLLIPSLPHSSTVSTHSHLGSFCWIRRSLERTRLIDTWFRPAVLSHPSVFATLRPCSCANLLLCSRLYDLLFASHPHSTSSDQCLQNLQLILTSRSIHDEKSAANAPHILDSAKPPRLGP